MARAGIAAVDAAVLVARAAPAGWLDRDAHGGVHLIAAGKAATAMAAAAIGRLGPEAVHAGVLAAPYADDAAVGRLESFRGGHPTPTPASARAGCRALALARAVPGDGLLLVLLSGGASAALAAPADGITLEDKRDTTARLLGGGADIQALNTVRKHLSAVKGGQLAAASAASCVTLAISDVVGDDLSIIGSGPTVADASTFADALGALRGFGGVEGHPSPVVARLRAGAAGRLPETPKPGDPRLARASARLIGSRADAMDGAAARARALGYRVVRVEEAIVGSARSAGRAHLQAWLARLAGVPGPACVIASGETTVHVRGPGKGGRNQEFALAAAEVLAAASVPAAVASVGTDGIDGPTDAAGAIADASTIARMQARGLGDPARYFDQNDAYGLFSQLGDLIHTGPTGTNVGDLQIVLLG
ncbi:MAG: DUF4147 domain-containing protein [Acidobacteria bacterium]|nr:DUF4147 domain-containing protein [Acidobacteriota bacterium]